MGGLVGGWVGRTDVTEVQGFDVGLVDGTNGGQARVNATRSSPENASHFDTVARTDSVGKVVEGEKHERIGGLSVFF